MILIINLIFILISTLLLGKAVYDIFSLNSYLREFKKLNSDMDIWRDEINDLLIRHSMIEDHIHFLRFEINNNNYKYNKKLIKEFRKKIISKYKKHSPSLLSESRGEKLKDLIG